MKLFTLCLVLLFSGCATVPSASESLDELAEAMIRHDIPGGYIGSNRSLLLYVRVGERDISPAVRQRLGAAGIEVRPGSAWRPGAGMMVSIPEPTTLGDGRYAIEYHAHCGERCGASTQGVAAWKRGAWEVTSLRITLMQ